MRHLTHCELFGGIGGFTLGAKRAGTIAGRRIQTTGYCEIDEAAIAVYKTETLIPECRIYRDVTRYNPAPGEFNIITAGFPCTGTSQAGKRTGLHHEESGLFREALRIICTVRPEYAVIEQPLGVIDRGLRAILGGLRMGGYSGIIAILSAARLGAGHRRQRLFIIAYPDRQPGNGTAFRAIAPGTEVGKIRDHSEWLTVERGSNGPDYGFSPILVKGDRPPQPPTYPTSYPNNRRGRMQSRILTGRAVTPAQAEWVMLWILNDYAQQHGAAPEEEGQE